ncbi:fungal fucose-specific lectin [Aspergillus keveii]|uniref:Fucose-specific lectin n=1 Tax=Aspergillus keveii TaxID=714993 RepID=A0ABR4FP75_9EURO
MSHVGAQQVRFRSAITALNNEDNVRVYSQDTSGGIREARYEKGKWTGGDEGSIVTRGILGTPIAAVRQDQHQAIHLFYITEGNLVRQMHRDPRGRWQDGNLNQTNVRVAPYSMIAACHVEGANQPLRLYVQLPDNTIQEYGSDGSDHGWSQIKNLGPALPGTGLACAVTQGHNTSVRLFLQDDNFAITERQSQDGQNWRNGDLSITKANPRTDLTALRCGDNEVRVYYVDQGHFDQPCVPGSQVAAVSWGSRRESHNDCNIRIYFQNGHQVTAITEWKYDGKWERGHQGLPPAQ